MSKKAIISLSVVLLIIAVVLILFWTLFALSAVTVEFSSSVINLNLTQEEIVQAAKFRYGASVLFEGKRQYIKNLENAVSQNENFAYLRVVNIETVFPNKFVVHVAEREELYAFEKDGQTYFCDRDFRVLRSADGSYSSTEENAILLKNLQVSGQFKVGDFLYVQPSSLKKLHTAFLKNNRTYSEQIAKFKEIELALYKDEFEQDFVSLMLTTFQGQTFVIKNPDFALANKVQLLYAVEAALYSQKTDEQGNILNGEGQQIFVYQNEFGQFLPYDEASGKDKIPLTYSLLNSCQVVVDNLSLSEHVKRTEKDIYYCLQINE